VIRRSEVAQPLHAACHSVTNARPALLNNLRHILQPLEAIAEGLVVFRDLAGHSGLDAVLPRELHHAIERCDDPLLIGYIACVGHGPLILLPFFPHTPAVGLPMLLAFLFQFGQSFQRRRIAIALTPSTTCRANKFRLSLLLDDCRWISYSSH